MNDLMCKYLSYHYHVKKIGLNYEIFNNDGFHVNSLNLLQELDIIFTLNKDIIKTLINEWGDDFDLTNYWNNEYGYVYMPYVPLDLTEFIPRESMSDRYSSRIIAPNFYSNITIGVNDLKR